MKNVIHARFGQFMYDAYNPSNIEVFFEFLNSFDEITMPNGKTYRMHEDRLESKEMDGDWAEDTSSTADLLRLVKRLQPMDWALVKETAKVRNMVDFSDFTRPS